MFHNRCSKISLFTWRHTGHDTDIFCCLFLHYKHGIVNSYDTDHAHFMIHDWKGNKTIFIDHHSYIFLIVCCMRVKHIRIHNLFDCSRFTGCQKFFDIDPSDQFSFFRNITSVDSLTIQTNLTDF